MSMSSVIRVYTRRFHGMEKAIYRNGGKVNGYPGCKQKTED